MALACLKHGPVGIATGLRVPLADARLDELVSAIVAHARQREENGDFDGVEDAAKQYSRQDSTLYKATDRISKEVAEDAESDRRLVFPLLEAAHAHNQWQYLTRGWRDLIDFARADRERDIALYSCAAGFRSEVSRNGGAGIHFGAETVDAILRGQTTVARMPVEFTRSGKCVQAHYKISGGDGGTYALLMSPEEPPTKCETVRGHRLRITSVEMDRFGDLTDEEARLEGFESRVARLKSWWRLHGQYPFDWRVWRYEFEPVEIWAADPCPQPAGCPLLARH